MRAEGKIRFGDFEADLRTGELRKHGHRLRLQEKPFQVLSAILERPGDLVTREELHQLLWGTDTFVDFDNNLNTAVYKLREVLGDTTETPRYIETWPKKGYRFIGTIEAAPVPANPEPGTVVNGIAPPARPRDGNGLPPSRSSCWSLLPSSPSQRARGRHPRARGIPVAQEAFLKGRYLMERGGVENAQRAAAYFEQSIANDPSFARAHAELANALAAYPSHRRESSARAKAAALKAIELAPKLADAHHRLASIYMYEDWNWNAAGEEFARAARLDPDSAAIHHSYAGYFSTMGQYDRALDEMRKALRLDPVSVAISADTGWYWFVARRNDEAIAQSKKALELEAQHRGAHYYMLLALLAEGNAVEARQWAAKYLTLLGGTTDEKLRALLPGEPGEGLHAFWEIRLSRARERANTEPVPAQELALLYASLGDTENALSCSRRGVTKNIAAGSSRSCAFTRRSTGSARTPAFLPSRAE